jgi:hypothetical protein
MWARYMIATTAGEPSTGFAPPAGISFTEVDKTSGGLATPYCPRNTIVREAFKSGTEPSHTCPTHTMVAPAPAIMFDEYGNPILTNTAPTTDTTGTFVPPDSTLTGGVFRDPTATAPPTTTAPVPPPPVEEEEEQEEEEVPPPATDTSTTTGGAIGYDDGGRREEDPLGRSQ